MTITNINYTTHLVSIVWTGDESEQLSEGVRGWEGNFPLSSACSIGTGEQNLVSLTGKIFPFTSMSDQDITSPCIIHTISSRQVMRIEKNIS